MDADRARRALWLAYVEAAVEAAIESRECLAADRAHLERTSPTFAVQLQRIIAAESAKARSLRDALCDLCPGWSAARIQALGAANYAEGEDFPGCHPSHWTEVK